MHYEEITFPATPSDRRPSCVTEPVDRERASKLRAFARTHGWYVPATPKVWAEPLAVLRRRVGDAVGEVLDWYVGWWRPGFRPEIRNGKEFRDRWEWLCKIHKRVTETSPPAEMHPDAAWVVADLKDLEWPAESLRQLPGVVSRSRDNLVAFMSHAKTTAGRIAVSEAVGTSVRDYLSQWFRAVLKRYKSWSQWSGDLSGQVWTREHPEFVKAARAACTSYYGDPTAWDRVSKEI